MNRKNSYLKILSGLLLCGMAAGVQSEEGVMGGLDKAVSEGSVNFDFRYRFENVDEDGFSKDANASTLRSRITFASGTVAGFNALAEFDNVSFIGNDNFNSTQNGKVNYPVVADPKYTEVNQAWLKYTWEELSGAYGRQRIVHGNQRFVGGVAWRQNEQTFDGFRAQWGSDSGLSVDYAYIYKVNRIFGPDDGVPQPAYWRGDNNLLRLDWKLNENHTLAGYYYGLDIDDRGDWAPGKSVDNSTDTIGIEYSGKFGPIAAKAAYARQEDAGDSNLNFDANYYMLEGAMNLGPVNAKIGYEVLGAGDGVGFKTPLATLHKFQGWADKFLVTPGDGIEDLYLGITGAVGPVKLGAYYHDFQAEDSGADFGQELDLVATWAINKQFTSQLKYATFDSDSVRYADTDKLWLTFQLKL